MDKLKILFITPRFPYPPLKGDQVVAYNRIRILGARHEITLLSFFESDEDLFGIKHLKPFCSSIHMVKLPKWRSMLNVTWMFFFSKLPLQILYYYSSALQQKIFTLLKDNTFDLIHAYMLRTAPYIADVSTPKIIELIDSMQLNLERRVALEKFPKRLFFKEELRRITKYEKKIVALYDHLIVVSEIDKATIPGNNVKVIPLGVDTNLFKPMDKLQKRPVIVFSGNMGYSPNIHAIKWFVENCMSYITASIPNVSLIIAGGNPPREICNMEKRPGITVTGYVESMPAILNQASSAIAPMQSGSGMQFKILEALACGIPVITTSIGKGSIDLDEEDGLFVADDPVRFAGRIIDILRNEDLKKSVFLKTPKVIKDKYSWESSNLKIETLYNLISPS